MEDLKQILEFNKNCAEFLGCKVDYNVADWTKHNDKSLTEHWNNNNEVWVKVPKGKGQEWYRGKHRDNFYQLFTDFTYQKLEESEIELGGEYNGKYYEVKDMQFHSDWNWIMEVVEAIERMGYNSSTVGGKKGYACAIHLPQLNGIMGQSKDSKKETVIEAIEKFFIWYNKQTK
jgi:hypothetical protein